MTPLKLVITNAGMDAFARAQLGEDIDLTIATVALTAAAFAVAPTLTSLPGEFARIPTVSGSPVGDDTVHMVVQDATDATYTVRGFGLILADGTLFAVYGQAEVLVEKSPLSTTLLAIDLRFPRDIVATIVFGDTNFLDPPATTTTKGVVELATAAEAAALLDATKALTPAAMRGVMNALMPVGAVMLWSGAAASVPALWAICDGREVPRSDGAGNITLPDLRDRVPVGAGGAHAVGDKFGALQQSALSALGGDHTPTGKMPAHAHGLPAQTSSAKAGVTVTAASTKADTAGGGTDVTIKTVNVGDPGHTHSLGGSTDQVAASALAMDAVAGHQHRTTIDVTQPSVALFFIMRI